MNIAKRERTQGGGQVQVRKRLGLRSDAPGKKKKRLLLTSNAVTKSILRAIPCGGWGPRKKKIEHKKGV